MRRDASTDIFNLQYVGGGAGRQGKHQKTRLEVDCTIFCILKITSFHTSHNNFKTSSLPSKLQKKIRSCDRRGCFNLKISPLNDFRVHGIYFALVIEEVVN